MQCVSDLKLGQIVVSNKGRDKLKSFVIVEIIDENFIKIADGKFRKIAKAKLKKVKHISLTSKKSELVATKFKENKKLLDEDLRTAISRFENGLDS